MQTASNISSLNEIVPGIGQGGRSAIGGVITQGDAQTQPAGDDTEAVSFDQTLSAATSALSSTPATAAAATKPQEPALATVTANPPLALPAVQLTAVLAMNAMIADAEQKPADQPVSKTPQDLKGDDRTIGADLTTALPDLTSAIFSVMADPSLALLASLSGQTAAAKVTAQPLGENPNPIDAAQSDAAQSDTVTNLGTETRTQAGVIGQDGLALGAMAEMAPQKVAQAVRNTDGQRLPAALEGLSIQTLSAQSVAAQSVATQPEQASLTKVDELLAPASANQAPEPVVVAAPASAHVPVPVRAPIVEARPIASADGNNAAASADQIAEPIAAATNSDQDQANDGSTGGNDNLPFGSPAPQGTAASSVQAATSLNTVPDANALRLTPAIGASAIDPAPPVQTTAQTVSALGAEIARKSDGKTSRFDITLTPEGLGKVDVKISISARGEVTAAMVFDTPRAAAELSGRSAELQKSLEQSGFQIAKDGLSFSDSGDRNFSSAQQNQQQAQQQSRQENRQTPSQAKAFTDSSVAADITDIAAARAYATPNSRSIDVRI